MKISYRDDWVKIDEIGKRLRANSKQGWVAMAMTCVPILDGPPRIYVFSAREVEEAQEQPAATVAAEPCEAVADKLPNPEIVLTAPEVL